MNFKSSCYKRKYPKRYYHISIQFITLAAKIYVYLCKKNPYYCHIIIIFKIRSLYLWATLRVQPHKAISLPIPNEGRVNNEFKSKTCMRSQAILEKQLKGNSVAIIAQASSHPSVRLGQHGCRMPAQDWLVAGYCARGDLGRGYLSRGLPRHALPSVN